MPCTTLLAGKNATYDGSTLMARNEDSGAGHFTPKKFIVVKPEDQPRHYVSVISKVEIELPDNPMRYTATPNALPDEGIWGAAGINDANVAMTATETLTSNPRVLGADPLFKGGIGEEDLVSIVLPYIRSAREGVKRLGSLLKEFGTYEINGIGFQDLDEIWWLETIGGHHWIAKRVPDDAYVVMPNQLGIDFFDFVDAFGAQKDHMCSEDMLEFIYENHLDVSVGGVKAEENQAFDIRGAFGSHSDSDHCYNTPRAWYMLKCLNPNTYKWDGPDADYTPESDHLPWSLVPERKLTIEDFKYILSSYYQGTDYNPYSKNSAPDKKGKYRVIGINRNNVLVVTQLRPYVPEAIRGIQWVAYASNAFNTMVPFYTNVDATPEYLANTGKTPTTESFYWANRILGGLADPHFGTSVVLVDRYQLKTASIGHGIIKAADKEFLEKYVGADISEIRGFLKDQNQKVADMVKEETYDLMDKVLFVANSEMNNAFSRSDA